ncbi:MAG: DNA-directed RNA polymerase subunit beta [Podoviridae sp. ctviO18]|nr:MAG: DNA-directed RNA polymerase subunit beta [Podoviridae sp. ctviO18]
MAVNLKQINKIQAIKPLRPSPNKTRPRVLNKNMFSITKFNKQVVIDLGFNRCLCGHYKDKGGREPGEYRGVVCDKCGSEVKRTYRIYVPRDEFDVSIGHWTEIKYPKKIHNLPRD